MRKLVAVHPTEGRPHSSLGHLTPNEFIGQRQVIQAAEEAVRSI
jgi:hypothetical protein